MRNVILFLTLVILTNAYGAGIPVKHQTDFVQIGRASSVDQVEMFFDVGDGLTNPLISVDKTAKTFDLSKDTRVQGDLTVGDGVANNKSILFDIGAGAGNPFLKWDNAGGAIVFSNDGVLEKKIGSGAGGAGSGINLLLNSSFEDPGSPILNWTNLNGTFTQENLTNGREGNLKFGRFVSTVAAEHIESGLITISDDAGATGGCMADVVYNQSDDVFDMKVLDASNNEISVSTLSDITKFQKAPTITFPCEAGDQFKMRLVSTAAGTLDVDSAYLGSNKGFVSGGLSNKFLGSLEWVDTAGCSWPQAATSPTDFPVDNDCDDNARIISGEIEDSSAGTLPEFTLPLMKKGHYRIMVDGKFSDSNSNVVRVNFRLNVNGDEIIPLHDISEPEATTQKSLLSFSFDLATDRTNILIKLQGWADSATDAAVIGVDGAGLKFNVYYFPSSNETQEAFTPEEANFFVNVNIGGATVNTLLTASPLVPNNATLDMVLNSGSAKIPCLSNPATGLTCSVGNEQIGLIVNIPRAGKYRYCFQFPLFLTDNSFFRLAETGLSDDTISQQSKNGAHAKTSSTENITLCEIFTFASAGEKSVKLFYEAQNTGGITIDRNAAIYDRDMNITVEMVAHNVSRPEIQNMVSTNFKIGKREESCTIFNNGTATMDTADGRCEAWITSVSRTGLGVVQITLSETPIDRPNCTMTPLEQERLISFPSGTGPTAGVATINTVSYRQDTEVERDDPFTIKCDFTK